MRKLNKGQSYIAQSPIIGQGAQIVYAEKTDTDIDISDMYRETAQQRHERVTSRYKEMLASNMLFKMCPRGAIGCAGRKEAGAECSNYQSSTRVNSLPAIEMIDSG